MMIRAMMATAAMVVAAPAIAQTAAPATVAAAPAVAIDPARLAIATRVAAKLLPVGTYKSVMKSSMDQVTKSMLDQMMDIPLRSFAGIGGLSEDQVAKLGPGTIRQIMAIIDPAFEQRTKLSMDAMGDMMATLMNAMEPDVRAGLAEALATRFTSDQLTTLDQFFSTPVGAAYAAQSITLYSDPAVMQRMQAVMPKMMAIMPEMAKKLQAATAGLPKPKRPDQLTPVERAKLKALMTADPAAVS